MSEVAVEMVYCGVCGVDVRGESLFCYNCGIEFTRIGAKKPNGAAVSITKSKTRSGNGKAVVDSPTEKVFSDTQTVSERIDSKPQIEKSVSSKRTRKARPTKAINVRLTESPPSEWFFAVVSAAFALLTLIFVIMALYLK